MKFRLPLWYCRIFTYRHVWLLLIAVVIGFPALVHFVPFLAIRIAGSAGLFLFCLVPAILCPHVQMCTDCTAKGVQNWFAGDFGVANPSNWPGRGTEQEAQPDEPDQPAAKPQRLKDIDVDF